MKIFEHYFNTFRKLLDTYINLINLNFLSKNAISPVHLDDFRVLGLVTMVGWDIQNPHDLEATFTSMPERGRCETFAIFWSSGTTGQPKGIPHSTKLFRSAVC